MKGKRPGQIIEIEWGRIRISGGCLTAKQTFQPQPATLSPFRYFICVFFLPFFPFYFITPLRLLFLSLFFFFCLYTYIIIE